MFTGNEDQQITLTEASDLNRNYRTSNPGQTQGHYFSRRTLEAILAQDGCVGVRVYYALDNNGGKELTIVGVESNENDLYNGFIGDRTYKNPPHSGVTNPLNS